MSLDKAIQHGKEKRKPYYGEKAFDPACRNHGGDDWSKSNRTIQRQRAEQQANSKIQEAQTEPVLTNREWLESLTDEQLAEMLIGSFKIFVAVDRSIGTKENDSRQDSIKKHIQWLRSKHKK